MERPTLSASETYPDIQDVQVGLGDGFRQALPVTFCEKAYGQCDQGQSKVTEVPSVHECVALLLGPGHPPGSSAVVLVMLSLVPSV